MNIISIDFSKKNTGVFTKIEGQESSFSISNSYKTPQEDALKKIYEIIDSSLKCENFNLGLIEGYGFNPLNKSSIIPMSEIGGVIKLAFVINDIPIITVPIQTWKMLTIGNINKDKYPNDYLEAVDFKYKRLFSNTDEADAFLIYQAAKELSKKTSRLTASMVKIREQIKNVIDNLER